MPRFVAIFLLLLAGLGSPASAAPTDGLPPRPVPFTFVTDQAKLLAPADARKLDGGLRRYADKNGTQIVVVTVPSLNGANVADYGRQLGTAWGVGQRGKDNGVVVLLAGKEHKLTIQAGLGLKSVITPALTERVISQEMTPAFKQGEYFGGLRKGLSSLMAAADPHTAATASTASTTPTTAAAPAAAASSNLAASADAVPADPAGVQQAEAPASSGGLGLGTLLVGAVVVLGGIWLISKLFRRNATPTAGASQAPNFMGNQPTGPNSAPNFGAPNAGYTQPGPGYGAPTASSGSGIGGMLATGAAAAAGAYLGNRMASGHESEASAPHNFDTNTGNAGAGAAAAGTGAAGDYFSSRNGGEASTEAQPDYFSDTAGSDNSGDYFSNDASYDDTSSNDTGGGGFDSTDDTSGSW